MDKTHNYRSAFYSCAAGMVLGAVFLSLVRPCKTVLCQAQKQGLEENVSEALQDIPEDFIEMDLGKIEDSVRSCGSRA